MIQSDNIRVLLVEDDEDDYILAKEIFAEITGQRFAITWIRNYEDALAAMTKNQHEICLVDYRLGAHNGVDLLREANQRGCQSPVILLTGAGEHTVDMEAMQAGAADYLVKSQLQAQALERSIRYAIQRNRAAVLAAFEQARLAAFGTEIGLVLTRRDSMEAILERCGRAMVQYLNATVARVGVFESTGSRFDVLVSVGQGAGSTPLRADQMPILLDYDALRAGKPILIKNLLADSRTVDIETVRKAGLVSAAVCPLILEEKLLGVMMICATSPLNDQITLEMGSVAHGIALYIERKRSEKALGASESKYRSVVESIKEVIFQLDDFGNWTFLNPAWSAITGFSVEQSLGTSFTEYLYQDDRKPSEQIFLKLIEREMEYCRYEARFLTKNGKLRWLEVYAQPAHSGDANKRGLSGSLTDITERKQAEAEIQKLAAFPQVNPNPILEFASNGTLTYANEAAREMAHSLGHENMLAILPEKTPEIVHECLLQGQNRLREEIVINNRTLTWSFFPVMGNHVVHCYGSDITDILNLEAQFRHAQKLESVGQLAAGVAHDFNNILTVIQGYADCLIACCKEGDRSHGPLKQISSASQRAAALTRQLLMFSRKQLLQPRVLELNSVLQNLSNMLPRLLGEDVALETEYGTNVSNIEADTGMLEQVIMNLAVNARDAMPRGGTLRIRTSSENVDASYASQHADARVGHFTCLTVTDTGCGMDRKTLERIFEPFFTTKEVGKGTGLGLATVYGIVKQHQGWVEVSSQIGVGTMFKIYIPGVRKKETINKSAQNSDGSVEGGKESILLVEDETVLREMVKDLLQSYNYKVIEARTGVEALRVWDEFDGKIDLLLTDMVMPEGLSGRDLAEQLRRRKGELKVILTSGYSADILGADFKHADWLFLPKPYFPPQLARLVRQCLDGATPAQAEAAL